MRAIPSDSRAPAAADPAVLFLRGLGAREREPELQRVMDGIVAPVVAQVIARKARLAPGEGGRFRGNCPLTVLDAEDAASVARMRLARALLDGREISDLRSYSAGVAYHAWDETLHRRFPSRRRLLHRIRYLLEGSAARTAGFALWTFAGREIAGPIERRGESPPTADERRGDETREAAATFLRSYFAGRRFLEIPPAELLRAIFGESGAPLPWEELAALLGDLWLEGGGRAEGQRIDDAAVAVSAIPATSAGPDELLSWRENLHWLWREVQTLGLRARTAFLLHAPVTRDFEYQGVASIRELAAVLDIPAEEFAGYWAEIPLDDLRIASRLGLARQQVINLRKSARIQLGRKVAEYLRV